MDKKNDPVSTVVFTIPERTNRVAMWLNQSFIIDIPLTSTSIDVSFVSKIRHRTQDTVQYFLLCC